MSYQEVNSTILIIAIIAGAGAIIIGALAISGALTILPPQPASVTTSSAESYRYNSVCEIGSTPGELSVYLMKITYDLFVGAHNNDPRLIEFFEQDEFLSQSGYTPDMVFSYDQPDIHPIFYNSTYFTPIVLEMRNVHPEVIDIMTLSEGETQEEFNARLFVELTNCRYY